MRRTFPRSPPSKPASQAVLTSPDILPRVCAFQPGLWLDMRPFLHLSSMEQSRDPLAKQLDHVESVFGPWFNSFGLRRVPRLLAALSFAKFIGLVYAVHVGDQRLIETISKLVPSISVVRMGELVDIAIASNRIDTVEHLKCVGFSAESNLANVFYGIGNAISIGHDDMAKHVAMLVESVKSQAVRQWVKKADRRLLTENLRTMFQSKQVEALSWLFQTWENYVPSSWMSRFRRECRQFAIEFHNWDYLQLVTNDLANPRIKYAEDLQHAIKLGSMDAIQWLVANAGVEVQHWHVSEAFQAFQLDQPKSSKILELLLTLCLPVLERGSERNLWVNKFMEKALILRHAAAMEVIWSKCAHPSTQHMIQVPTMLRDIGDLDNLEFSTRTIMTTLGQSDKCQLGRECLPLALRAKAWTWVNWWLEHIDNDANMDIVLEAKNALEKRT
ncbi:hypothetical protein AeRB84_016312 [Aphanomyces euteiches]|nr:hypothetical protein AeRB84_016312 [Aphanomyces euteiches]